MTASAPSVSLRGLDELWFQIAGTLCNLTCTHCFICCSPTNHAFELLPTGEAMRALEESRKLGVKEYYFTGGEPFLHPELVPILETTLAIGPATVLTNATLLKASIVERLARAEAASLYSLEFRVSLDGASPETNDVIRGRGAFDRTMRGLRLLLEKGFLPVVTVAQTWEDGREGDVFEEFVSMLKGAGYPHPRIKIIPTLRIGAEVTRHRGYEPSERITEELLDDFDLTSLICTRSRVVTQRGVYVCPILLDAPGARLGGSLSESLGGFALSHGACYTCYLGGSICANPSAGAGYVG